MITPFFFLNSLGHQISFQRMLVYVGEPLEISVSKNIRTKVESLLKFQTWEIKHCFMCDWKLTGTLF
jgi:hypothetical protein